jgi:glycosyltransferase involved in cell wall biosynthesis
MRGQIHGQYEDGERREQRLLDAKQSRCARQADRSARSGRGGAALGAAILAGIGAGLYRDEADARAQTAFLALSHPLTPLTMLLKSGTAMQNVFIVLATFQGAAYLRQLIESIRQQSHADWTLLARDDGSTDQTPRILRQTAAADPRIAIIEDGHGRVGAARNFGLLMQEAHRQGAEYLFPADQDDIWQPDKIGKLLKGVQAGEARAGQRAPHLTYSDLAVVDQQMRAVHPSLLRYSRLRHGEGRPLKTLLGRSFVLGCACAMNRPLLEFALPLPESVASHDWWTALCAAAVGEISYLPEATLWYRRHARNTSGPAGFWGGFNPLRHSWATRWQTARKSFRQSIQQAASLRQRLHERNIAPAEILPVLDRFCEIFGQPVSGPRRIGALRRLGIPAIDRPRRLLYYLCVLALGRASVIRPSPLPPGQG